MIKAYAKEQDFEGAKGVFRSFRGTNSMFSNSFLDACVQCGNLREASAHFAQMKRTGLANTVSYNTMLKAYIKRGQISEAQELLKEMAGQGLKASRVTYHELLNSMVTNRDRKNAWHLSTRCARLASRSMQ
jgi:pentatricopeptide repeat protein